MKISNSVTAVLLMSVISCSGETQKPEQTRGLGVSLILPRIVAMGVHSSRSVVVESVYAASAQAGFGQVVKTGTIEANQFGIQYLPQPTDRLIAKFDGQVHEFVLKDAQGNNQAESAAVWLANPHILTYSHKFGDIAQADISERLDGSDFNVQVSGWYVLAGTRYEINLAATGQASGNRDFDGSESKTEFSLSGKISGGGLEIGVDERHSSTFASSTSLRLLTTMRGSAGRYDSIVNNTLRSGGSEFKFQDVHVQIDERTKGNNSSSGVTAFEGVVLRNGSDWGRCVLQGNIPVIAAGTTVLPLDMSAGVEK